jgi:hypothetical protein
MSVLSMKDLIWLSFLSIYTVLLITELMAVIISDIAMVVGVRLVNYWLIFFTHYLRRKVGGGTAPTKQLYTGLVGIYQLGDTLFYPLALILSTPAFLVVWCSASLLLSLLRLIVERWF